MASTSALQPVPSIASTLARQNVKGEIVCILCNAPVKSAKVWTAHINGRQHRESIAKVKSQTAPMQSSTAASSSGGNQQFAVPKSKQNDTHNGHAMKRKLNNLDEQDMRGKNKIMKVQSATAPLPSSFFTNSGVDENHVEDDDDDDDDDDEKDGPVVEGPMPKPEHAMEVDEKEPTEKPAPKQEQKLPAGFFDDNKADKKARGVEVEVEKRLDDEYEKFKREMQAVDTKRANEMESIDEKDDALRTIDEISTQIEQWRKVNELQERKEQMAVLFGASATAGHDGNDRSMGDDEHTGGSGDEDVNVDVLFDWRAKQL